MINSKNNVPVPGFLIGVIEELALIYALSIDELHDLIDFQVGREFTTGDIEVAIDWLLKKSGKPWAPLQFGTLINIRQTGRLGPLIASCCTVGDALQLFHRYHQLMHPFMDLQPEKVGKRLALKMPAPSEIPPPIWHAELLLGGIPYWVERFTGKEMMLHEVWFRHPAPDHVEHYHAQFHCDVLFEQPYDCLWTDANFLGINIQTYSPTFHSGVLTAAEAELKSALTFSERIKNLTRSRISEDLSIEEIARHVLCSERTLQRKLAEEGTSVKKLKQEVKCEEATLLLSGTMLSLEQIAYKLGYEQRSSFATAFQQWTGLSPLEWRARHKKTS